ncbi:hypothetical protein QJS10_CPA01g01778 [Acorus calamus]|uniref:RNase H type-1 domain-containing protein n=1 Tax=Acorus calamus TaxID=4465 RepID=A0AAV9FFW5_ACOCL|nr:hypothetical protein QJS10_CPA01g01778 [Acorus calamus]
MARTQAASINVLELKGIAEGLKLCLRLGNLNLLKVWSELDSTTAIAWANGKGVIPWTALRDLRLIHHISSQLTKLKASHVFREGNRVADCLASLQSSIGTSVLQPSHQSAEIVGRFAGDGGRYPSVSFGIDRSE